MANLNLSTKKITYSAADVSLLKRAHVLCTHVLDFDSEQKVKQDAGTAKSALAHVLAHVLVQRNGKAEKQAE